MKDLQTLPPIISQAKLSYRVNGCYINSHHHTQSFPPLGSVFVYPVCEEGRVPNAVLIGMAECQVMDGWLGGETVSQCLSLTVSVSESMTAICQFHRQFSALYVCPSLCCRTVTGVLTLLLSGVFVHTRKLQYVHCRNPVNFESIANTYIIEEVVVVNTTLTYYHM